MTKGSGEIKDVFISEGSEVKEGDVLFTTNGLETDLQLEQINAQINSYSRRIELLSIVEENATNGTNYFDRYNEEELIVETMLPSSDRPRIHFGDALISFNATSAGIIGGTASALASYAASRVVSTTLKFLLGSTGWGFIIGTAAYALNVLYVGTKLKNAGASGRGATLCKNAAGYSVNVW